MEKQSIDQLKKIASQVRRDCLRMVHAVQSGHPGAALGLTEYFVALYFHEMTHDKSFNFDGKNEDLFFFPTVMCQHYGTVFCQKRLFFCRGTGHLPENQFKTSGTSCRA